MPITKPPIEITILSSKGRSLHSLPSAVTKNFSISVFKSQNDVLLAVAELQKRQVSCLLLIDENPNTEIATQLIRKLILKKHLPISVIFIADSKAAESSFVEIRTEITCKNIPVYFLRSLENPKTLQSVIDKSILVSQVLAAREHRNARARLSAKFELLHKTCPGKVIHCAIETLGTSFPTLVKVFKKQKLEIDEIWLNLLRNDKIGDGISAAEWVKLCDALYLPYEAIGLGYNVTLHLVEIEKAIKEKRYRFPKTESLEEKLAAIKFVPDVCA